MWRSLRKVLKRCLLSKPTTRLVLPFLAAIPPIILAVSGKKQPWPRWFFDEFNPWLARHPAWEAVFFGWTGVLILGAYFLAEIKDWLHAQDDLGEKELAVLLHAFDTPVGKKLKRFGKVAQRIKSQKEKPEAGAVFHEITQPDEQIALLVEGVYLFFSNDDEHPERLAVNLAKMEKGMIEAFETFLPHGRAPSTNPTDLRQKEATMNRAASTREIIIIPDIAKEMKKTGKARQYIAGTGASRMEGSLISFPVVDSELNSVPFVINIKSSTKNHFALAKKERYRFALQRFSERIAMENRLRIIKQAANHHS